MLKISNLVKTYKGTKTPSLKGISFEVDNGEVYGLIGKNGAGKSTAIKCLTGILPFEKGDIKINGWDIKKQSNKAKALIGYVPDNHSVYENITGREYINFLADVYGVSLEDRERHLRKYGKLFNMTDALDLQINGYSHGMHQKICIMGALVNNPKLWVLDEPLLGLDPRSINIIKKCIRTYTKNKRRMVLFTSHDLATVTELCDKVCILDNGEVKQIIDMHEEGAENKIRKILS